MRITSRQSNKTFKTLQNWSGFVRFTPRQVVKPRSLDELQQIVRECARNNRSIRVVGSGHSSCG